MCAHVRTRDWMVPRDFVDVIVVVVVGAGSCLCGGCGGSGVHIGGDEQTAATLVLVVVVRLFQAVKPHVRHGSSGLLWEITWR